MENDHPSRASSLLVHIGTVVWVAVGIVILAAALRPASPLRSSAPPAGLAVSAAALTSARARAPALAADEAYAPAGRLQEGREWVMVFIGASFCGANREPGFPQQIERAKLLVQQQAAAAGAGFRAIAVSLDWQTDTALAFLEPFGRWDEMSIGGNWQNEGALRYIWQDVPGSPTVPQVLLLERELKVGQAIGVTGTREVRRVLGTASIRRWVQGGARA